MPFPTLLALAVALAMDAFAVALATGVCLPKVRSGHTLRMAGAFGLFQGGMPVAGFVLGLAVRPFVERYTGWTAFGLLALVGAKMLWEAFHKDEEACATKDPTRGLALLLLAVATSIDALAVGLTFSVLGTPIWTPALVIGLVCALITACGLHLGALAGRVAVVSRYAEILGGLVLIAIGVKILLDSGSVAL
ncbi:manganese efflux pump MntP family protein [Fundidesulfovibrio butyratiphilus]